MHPETARALIAQRRDDLVHDTASSRRGSARRLFPRWRVSWSRTILAPAGAQASAPATHSGRASRAGRGSRASQARRASRRGSSLVIIITAHRSA
jgi:hypothetical protein